MRKPLDQVLKEITPLPWSVYEGPEDRPERTVRALDRHSNQLPQICDGFSDEVPSREARSNAAYLAHAANVLPELVEALKTISEAVGPNGDMDYGLQSGAEREFEFEAQLRNLRGLRMSLEAVANKALARATSVNS